MSKAEAAMARSFKLVKGQARVASNRLAIATLRNAAVLALALCDTVRSGSSAPEAQPWS